MDLDNIKMWSCKKYPSLSVMAATAESFCAKRYEASVDGKNEVQYSSCVNCDRGAILYDLGKHKTGSRKDAKGAKGETNRVIFETKAAKGETIMAKEWHKSCDAHGPYTATGPRGGCPKCKEAKPAAGKPGVLVPSSPLPSAVLGGEPSGAVSINIDLARFPKLHSRLVSVGLNAMLAELETKA